MDRLARLLRYCDELEEHGEEYIAVWWVKQELTKHLASASIKEGEEDEVHS